VLKTTQTTSRDCVRNYCPLFFLIGNRTHAVDRYGVRAQ